MIFSENYERGMKMLVKIAKNPNATLCLDVEEKGKGKRLKKSIKYFDDSDKENNVVKRRNAKSMLPPVPKLENVIKSARINWPLPDKVDKKVKHSTYIKTKDLSYKALSYLHNNE